MLDHDGRKLPPYLAGHWFGLGEVPRVERVGQLLDDQTSPHVLGAAKGMAAPLVRLALLEDRVAEPERRVDRLVAVCGAECAGPLMGLRAHEVANRGAQGGLLEFRVTGTHQAIVDIPEAGDGQIASVAPT